MDTRWWIIRGVDTRGWIKSGVDAGVDNRRVNNWGGGGGIPSQSNMLHTDDVNFFP